MKIPRGVVDQVMHLADVGVVQLGQSQGLPPEALRGSGVLLVARAQPLDGHAPLQHGIPGPIDLAHAPVPKVTFDPEPTDWRQGRKDITPGLVGGAGLEGLGHSAPGYWVYENLP